jgi:hypothetical protein
MLEFMDKTGKRCIDMLVCCENEGDKFVGLHDYLGEKARQQDMYEVGKKDEDELFFVHRRRKFIWYFGYGMGGNSSYQFLDPENLMFNEEKAIELVESNDARET